jgi:site-specific DNA recombinase
MKAAIYARYSSELQRATSITDQIRLTCEFANRAGYTTTDHFICTDEEISGTTTDRPGYRRLLEFARGHQIDAIFCESPDRLWRDAGKMHQALKRLTYWGVRVFSTATGTNVDLTDRTGKILSSLIGIKDELFIEDLLDKTRRGLIGQVHPGFSAGGRAFGYRSESPDPTEGGDVTRIRRPGFASAQGDRMGRKMG